ncbi:hypothetical protein PYW08_006559 [Mythimna loreyi]|uniref:Uncharacterized protein n=1 Tax=Mythimna loreyi TaxID=667449 RepID=A0ACC2QQK1_9NEOP|nr:hypothetical protein PYW08_006559 [Mythimna loreyi]
MEVYFIMKVYIQVFNISIVPVRNWGDIKQLRFFFFRLSITTKCADESKILRTKENKTSINTTEFLSLGQIIHRTYNYYDDLRSQKSHYQNNNNIHKNELYIKTETLN